MKANKLLVRSDPRRCAARVSPCSTFKVPLALIAFDAGLLSDENSVLKWDGKVYKRPDWNRDQTAASWMRESVVWFSQLLTPKLGMKRLTEYLQRFDYGNGDMSSGLTTAWLDGSLTISPDEQLRFWQRWWRGELSVSPHAVDVTKKITRVDSSPAGWTLHGKTGSGTVAAPTGELSHGWFVGHVARGDREYVFVTNYTDRVKPADDGPGGPIARELTKKILTMLGMY